MKWIYWTIFCAASVSACGPSNQALVDEAERAYQAGEMELAIVYYEEAVEKVPEDLVAKTRLALLLIREGDRHAEEELWASALARYERGLDLGGEGVREVALLLRVIQAIEASGGDRVWASELLQECVQKGGEDAVLWRDLAAISERLGQAPLTQEIYRRLMQLDELETRSLPRLAQLQRASGAVDQAKETLRELLLREPSSLVARVRLVELIEEQAPEEAEQLLIEVAQAHPERTQGWGLLLDFYQRHHQESKAAEVAAKIEALKAPPKKMRPLR